MSKKILVVAQVIDEATGAIEDANTTEVTGQDQAAVDAFKAAFEAFGAAQSHALAQAGGSPSQVKQHRHSTHHGKP